MFNEAATLEPSSQGRRRQNTNRKILEPTLRITMQRRQQGDV